MSLYIKKFDLHTQYEQYMTGNTTVLPNVSYCEDVKDVHINPLSYNNNYFTTVALEAGTISFTPRSTNVISYSFNNGASWTSGNSVPVNSGDEVIWKGTMTPQAIQGIGTFSSTCNFEVKGNTMSLIFGDNFMGKTSIEGKSYCFTYLFSGATKLITAENLVVPATTLAERCYDHMFFNCSNLTTAPTLPAKTLVQNCYDYMFNGCTNLNYIKAMFTTAPSSTYTVDWVSGVSASGTFVKNFFATWDVSGAYGIPEGWTIKTEAQ